jgi:hypothetical protein
MKPTHLALAILVGGCAHAAGDTAVTRLQLVPEADRPLGEILLHADRVVAGRLLTVERAERYEPIGQFNFGGTGSEHGGTPQAYDGKLQVDSTLVGSVGRTVSFTFFAPKGAPIPRPDTTAIWVLHRRTLLLRQRCSEIQSMTSATCPYDVGLALDSDVDVRPLTDWPRLVALARTLGLEAAAHPSR